MAVVTAAWVRLVALFFVALFIVAAANTSDEVSESEARQEHHHSRRHHALFGRHGDHRRHTRRVGRPHHSRRQAAGAQETFVKRRGSKRVQQAQDDGDDFVALQEKQAAASAPLLRKASGPASVMEGTSLAVVHHHKTRRQRAGADHPGHDMIVQGASDGLVSAQGAFKAAKEFVLPAGDIEDSAPPPAARASNAQHRPLPEEPETLVAASRSRRDLVDVASEHVDPEEEEDSEKKPEAKEEASEAKEEAPAKKDAGPQAAVQLETLLKDYDSSVAPPRNSEGMIDMALAFRANKLLELDHVEQTVTWVGWVRQYWYDPRLEWTSSDGKHTPFLPVKTDQIWLPDTTLYNAMDFNWGENCDDVAAFIIDDAQESRIPVAGVNEKQRAFEFTVEYSRDWQQDYKAQLKEGLRRKQIEEKVYDPKLVSVEDKSGALLGSGNGFGQPSKEQFPLVVTYAHEAMRFNVMWSRPCVLKAKCDVDLKWYPFDTNVCPLEFSPWAYSFLNMHVALGANENVVKIPEFNVEMADVTAEWTPYAASHLQKDAHWPSVIVRMQITRHGHYYVVNYICPIMLMVMLTWISFWIPIQVSDRVSYTVTVLLTVMAVNFITADKRPATDEDMWLDNFQTATLLFVTGATFYTVALHKFGPQEAWPEEKQHKRKLLLEYVESGARIIFPIVAFVVLGCLFAQLEFGEAHNGSEKDFTGTATRWIFGCIFVGALVLCTCIALQHFPQKSLSDKVDEWEEWLANGRPRSTQASAPASSSSPPQRDEILG